MGQRDTQKALDMGRKTQHRRSRAPAPCLRFGFDTYDRELERYGGSFGTGTAERVFGVDSRAVARILHLSQSRRLALDRTILGVLSVDSLLSGLGLDEAARLEWYRNQLWSRQEASLDYRDRKALLRNLLGDSERLRREPGGADLYDVLAVLREELRPLAENFKILESSSRLTRPLIALQASFVHLHFNRIGIDRNAERKTLGLLWRAWRGRMRAPLNVDRNSEAR